MLSWVRDVRYLVNQRLIALWNPALTCSLPINITPATKEDHDWSFVLNVINLLKYHELSLMTRSCSQIGDCFLKFAGFDLHKRQLDSPNQVHVDLIDRFNINLFLTNPLLLWNFTSNISIKLEIEYLYSGFRITLSAGVLIFSRSSNR